MNSPEQFGSNASHKESYFDSEGRLALDSFQIDHITNDDKYKEIPEEYVRIILDASLDGKLVRVVEEGNHYNDQGDRVDRILVGDLDGNGQAVYFQIPIEVSLSSPRESRRPESAAVGDKVNQIATKILPENQPENLMYPTLSEMQNWAMTSRSAEVYEKALAGDPLALYEMQQRRATASIENVEKMRGLVELVTAATATQIESSQGDVFDLRRFGDIVDEISRRHNVSPEAPLPLNLMTRENGLRGIASEIMNNSAYSPLRGRFTELIDTYLVNDEQAEGIDTRQTVKIGSFINKLLNKKR